MKTKNSLFAAAIVAAAAATVPGMAGAQTVVTQPTISLNAAMTLATAALERCRADGYKVTVTVLNRHAAVSVVLSDDGVNPHTVENSLRKAYTAFTTKSPSGDMQKRPPAAQAAFMQLANITTLEGALPIFSNKEIIGAVGISGAPGGEKDAACAKVGLDKIGMGG